MLNYQLLRTKQTKASQSHAHVMVCGLLSSLDFPYASFPSSSLAVQYCSAISSHVADIMELHVITISSDYTSS